MNEESSSKTTVTIKKYANRRLYNTATSSYVTLESLSLMVKEGIEFNVYDAKTSEDITRSVLTQIIVEEEGKSGQQTLLPIGFLRQLIGFYGGNMQWLVPKYLEHSMQTLAKNQGQLSNYFQTAFGNMFPFGGALEEVSKQNMAMFESAMRLFSPFAAAEGNAEETAGAETAANETVCRAKAQTDTASVSNINRRTEAVPAPCPCAVEKPAVAAASVQAAPASTPMPNVRSATVMPSSTDDMQQKIANLQRQLADLAKNRA